MSGFEIAGLVLGAIPLVIEALNAYRAGRSSAAIFFKHGEALQDLISELQMQNALFQSNIESLMRAAGVDLDEIEALKDSDGRLMYADEGDEDVRDFLGAAHEPFVQHIAMYLNKLERIAKSLRGRADDFYVSLSLAIIDTFSSVQPENQTCEQILQARKHSDGSWEFRKRLKLTMSKGEIQLLVGDLQRYNSQLSQLCNNFRLIDEHDVGPIKPMKKAGKITTSLISVQEHAQQLFDVLSRSWSSCHSQHEMHMRLEPRLDALKKANKKDTLRRRRHAVFRVGLGAADGTNGSVSHGLQWFETRVIPPDINSQIKRSVKVTIRVDEEGWPPGSVVAQNVTDLCACIWQANQDKHCLHFFIESNQLKAFPEGCEPAPVLCNKHQYPVALAQLLDQSSANSDTSLKLGLTARLLVAIILASTLFQLAGTSWMIPPPFKSHVLFPRRKRPVAGSTDVDAAHPFISTAHLDTSNTVSLKISVLELAIVLLELWHNNTFENFCRAEGEAVPEIQKYYERHTLVVRWFDRTKEDLVSRHKQAVSFCIQCVTRDTDFDDRSFRHDMYAGVLVPLLDNANDVP